MNNHDYEHCADCRSDCPQDCFRAQLVRDLGRFPAGMYISWMHFRGTEECMQKDGKKVRNNGKDT